MARFPAANLFYEAGHVICCRPVFLLLDIGCWPSYLLTGLWPGYLAPAKLPAAGQQTFTEGKVTSSSQSGRLMARISAAGHVNKCYGFL